MLSDNFGRIHDYLRISLTEKCNLRCTYCMPAEGLPLAPSSLFMKKDELIKIAANFVSLGIKKIRLTGGEPLVCKDAREIIMALSAMPVSLAITTNGILVNEYIDTFKKAGLNSVNVSLDTLQKDKFISIARRDELEQVIANIHLLLHHNFSVKVNMVVMNGVNEDEILDFVELTRLLPLHVRFIEFMPFEGNKWQGHKVFPFKKILELIETRYSYIKLQDEKNDTAKKFKVLGNEGTFAVISTMSDPFCGSCNRLRLTADGKMKNCLFSNGEMDLLTPLRKGENIHDLIEQCVILKKEQQGGRNPAEFSLLNKTSKSRTMAAIGG